MVPYEHQKRATYEALNDLDSSGYHALFMEVGTGKSKVILDTACALKVGTLIRPRSHCQAPGKTRHAFTVPATTLLLPGIRSSHLL